MFDTPGYSGIVLWLSGSLLIVAVLLVISRLSSTLAFIRTQHKLAKDKTLIHEYKASSDLSPVELGYIFDRKFRDNELLALLVSMHQSRLIVLKPESGGLTIGHSSEKKPYHHLSMLEMEVMSFLEKAGGKPTWNTLSKAMNAGNEMHARFESLVRQELETKGYFEKDSLRRVAARMRRVQLFAGFILSVAFVIFPLQQAILYSESNLAPGFAGIDELATGLMLFGFAVLLWPLWYIYVWIIAQIIYHGSGLPFGATAKLRKSWPKVYGHMVFLNVVEKNRLAVDPNLDDPALPWVMAIGAGPKANKLR